MSALETIEHKGYTIEIHHDENPTSPREWDNLGTLVCWHRRYTLGDEHEFTEPERAREHFKATGAIVLPVYMYDHSGITLRTTPFSCPWDSGQVGYIYVEPEKARREMQTKRLTKEVREKIEKVLAAEVETYAEYVSGQVYGYVVEQDGRHVGSCWGYLGSDREYMLECAKDTADADAHELVEDAQVV